MFIVKNIKELTVIHDSLVSFLDSEDYTDEESVIIAELLSRCEQEKELYQ